MNFVKNGMVLAIVAAFAAGASAQTTYSAGGGAIIDTGAGCGSAASTPTVYPSINIAGEAGDTMSVALDGLQHTWAGDLEITLDGPSGFSTQLLDRPGAVGPACGSSADFVAGNSYEWANDGSLFSELPANPIPSGVFQPTADGGVAAAALPSGNLNGDWTLTIRDWSGADTGSIAGWSITATPEPSTLGLVVLGGLALIRRRR